MKKILMCRWIWLLLIAVFVFACNNKPPEQPALYTCPMPEDSVFSDKPGKCPKCGMDLIMVEKHEGHNGHGIMEEGVDKNMGYACPMHPNVKSDKAGSCPVCGMPLEKMKPDDQAGSVSLNTLLKPANQQVVASVPMVHMQEREEDIEMESYGFITYDTRQVGAVSANISGRIEKLYVKYRYQPVSRGQKIMEVYSPELLTAQENLLFLLKNDPENQSLLDAAKQKLILLGMNNKQLTNVIQTGKAALTVSVYSNYNGHIHESGMANEMQKGPGSEMNATYLRTQELTLKEGTYVQKGQNIFSVFNAGRAWAVLNIFSGQAGMVKVGDKVRITPETDPEKDFRAEINYIEPFFRENSKTLTARVYFDNSVLKIPVGSQVKATVFAGNRSANWLPEEAVLSLGVDKVVFVKTGESFTARKIETGIINKHLIQVLGGLEKNEAVAANAQYLVDIESFIKTNQ